MGAFTDLRRTRMKTRTRRTAIAVALTSLLGVAGAGSAPSWASAGSEQSASNDRVGSQASLEGTWRAVVTRQDCQTGAPGPTFPALLTFDHEGTLIETTAAFPPSQRTPGHGFWNRTGRRQFTAVSEAFLFSPTNVWGGVQRITQAITIGDDPRDVTSTATFEILNTTGQVVGSGCAAAVLTRMT
jgi:hypothetical protein